ncbi:MAG: hypothetical protein IH789_11430 [Acidobacteria bacterium]|nr:hypothetical protein [Acidobacteriota bacterium]
MLEYDESLVVPDESRALADGAIDPWTKPRYVGRRRLLREVAERRRIPFDVSWRQLSATHRQLLLDGKSGGFQGIFPFLRALERKRVQLASVLRRHQHAQILVGRCRGDLFRRKHLHCVSPVPSFSASSPSTASACAAAASAAVRAVQSYSGWSVLLGAAFTAPAITAGSPSCKVEATCAPVRFPARGW